MGNVEKELQCFAKLLAVSDLCWQYKKKCELEQKFCLIYHFYYIFYHNKASTDAEKRILKYKIVFFRSIKLDFIDKINLYKAKYKVLIFPRSHFYSFLLCFRYKISVLIASISPLYRHIYFYKRF